MIGMVNETEVKTEQSARTVLMLQRRHGRLGWGRGRVFVVGGRCCCWGRNTDADTSKKGSESGWHDQKNHQDVRLEISRPLHGLKSEQDQSPRPERPKRKEACPVTSVEMKSSRREGEDRDPKEKPRSKLERWERWDPPSRRFHGRGGADDGEWNGKRENGDGDGRRR